MLCCEGRGDDLREVVKLREATHAQEQHADLRMQTPERADLGKRGIDPLADELFAEVVIADRGSCHLHPARAHLHAGEAVGGGDVAWGEQQRTLAQVELEVEGILGVGCQLLERTVQAHQGGIGLRRVAGQLHRQVAVVGEGSHDDARVACGTALQHRLKGQVEAEGPEGAAHAHALRAQDHLHHPVDGVEARAIDGVEEVHQGGELRAQPLHRVQHGLTGDGVEAVAEVGLEDGVALLSHCPEGVAERLGPALGQAGLQRLQLARRRERRPRAHGQLERPLEDVAPLVDGAQGGRLVRGRRLGLLCSIQLVQRDKVAARQDVPKQGRHLCARDARHEPRDLVDEGDEAAALLLSAQREQQARAPAETVLRRALPACGHKERALRLLGGDADLRD